MRAASPAVTRLPGTCRSPNAHRRVHRRGRELGVGSKLAPLLLAEEMEDARRDRLRGCFEATEDEIRDEGERLVMCEVVCGVVSDELRRDVVFRCDALCAQEILEVRPELDG